MWNNFYCVWNNNDLTFLSKKNHAMNFFKKLFYKKVKMLGRAGIMYNDIKQQYYLNSECLVGPPYDVVIFVNDIYYYKNGQKLNSVSKKESEEIANQVKKELELRGMNVELFNGSYGY